MLVAGCYGKNGGGVVNGIFLEDQQFFYTFKGKGNFVHVSLANIL